MKRIVVKIGSNLLASADTGLNTRRISAIAKNISALIEQGHRAVVVSSGAVAAGLRKLGLKSRPRDIKLQQAAAAVGQSRLMWAYERHFAKHHKKVAQVLLTRDDISDRVRYINAKNTLLTLLSYGIVPLINENDPIATDEIKFGDNDMLAALVSGLVEADLLVILSDVDGLYNRDPAGRGGARIVRRVKKVTPDIQKMAGGQGSALGTGGMYSKLLAAKQAADYGIPVVIMSGTKSSRISRVLDGASVGTYFEPSAKRVSSRKGWIAFGVRSKGAIVLDDGAVKALTEMGKSLLPSGISKVEGPFSIGDFIKCVDREGKKVAKGLTNYSAEELEKIKGKKTSEIERILGYKYSDEVIHRDNMVIV